MDEDGIEDAFELQAEIPEKIRTGIWVRTFSCYAGGFSALKAAPEGRCLLHVLRPAARRTSSPAGQPAACLPPHPALPVSSPSRTHQVGDCFIYNNAAWRLNYCVGGEVTTLYHLDRCAGGGHSGARGAGGAAPGEERRRGAVRRARLQTTGAAGVAAAPC